MKILILGASGMLGHKLYQKLAEKTEIYATLREPEKYGEYGIFNKESIYKYSIEDGLAGLDMIISELKPDYLVNCIGITKQQSIANDPIPMITVNALYPHQVDQLCRKYGVKGIYLSTDCVFSGNKGMYTEYDLADACDIYGRTKLLGEVTGENALTIRTSIIGRELISSYGLVEWFLSQKGKTVKGYQNAVFSGFTTSALSDILLEIMSKHPNLTGLYNISADPINKYDLLEMIKAASGLDIQISPDSDFICNRSLDSRKFRNKTGIVLPRWDNMIDTLCSDFPQYEIWRNL